MSDKYRSDYGAIYYMHILMDFFLMALIEKVCVLRLDWQAASIQDGWKIN